MTAFTQAQIDAAKAVLTAALDAKDASGANVSTYNGAVIAACTTFANQINAGLPALQAAGLDTSQAVALLNAVFGASGLTGCGQALRALSNQASALVASGAPPPVDSQFAPPDLMDMDIAPIADDAWSGLNSVTRYIARGNMSGSSYGDWPDYYQKYTGTGCYPTFGTEANGLKFIRNGITGGGTAPRDMDWIWQGENNLKDPTKAFADLKPTEMWWSYAHCIEQDAFDNRCDAQLGIKFSGPGCVINGNTLSACVHHALFNLPDHNQWQAEDYTYSAQSQENIIQFPGVTFRPNRYYAMEGHVRMNTFTNGIANADGVEEHWINGVQVFAKTDRIWVQDPASAYWTYYQQQIYEGGNAGPTFPGNSHFRTGRIRVSSAGRIGPAPELLAEIASGIPTPIIPMADVPVPSVAARTPGASTPAPSPTPVPTPTPSPTPTPPSAVPKWRQGLPVGQWTAIPTAVFAKVGTPQNIDAWCGLAAIDDATHATWVNAAGGGHVDSNDNGVYALDLMQDVPAWSVMCPPSALADRVTTAESAQGMSAVPYAHDGKPNSSHTYWSLVWCPQRGRVFRPFAASLFYAAQSAGNMDGFDPVAGKWDVAGTWPSCPKCETQAMVACDPLTGDIYYGATGDGSLWRWNQASNAWGPVPSSGFGFAGYEGAVVDRLRKRLVRAGYLPSAPPVISQIATLDLTSHAAIIVSTGITTSPGGPCTITHDYDADAFYLTDSVSVWKLNGTALSGTLLGPLPVAPANGVLGRFAYFSTLKGIAYCPSGAGTAWFMATA